MRFEGTSGYVATEDLRIAVNAAVTLERPLLVKGEPGTGKTILAQEIAGALNAPLIEWHIKSTTKAQQGLYEYDAVSRLRDSQLGDERVKDMNAGGILGSMCFPSFPGFAGRLFATEDPEFSLALVQAYNDWHVEEWCGAYPARFIPMTLPVIWDPVACAAEIRRNAARGMHSLTFSENPSAMGYPSFHDFDYWKPMWDALVDTDTVLNVHIGSSGRLAITAPDAPMDVMITLQPMNIVQAAADLLWSKPIKEYPGLKIALSEGGTGWIPYFLERVDRTYEMHSTWTGQDFGGKLPSEVFREHFLTCFIADPVGVSTRHSIGIDNICWEADYPHSDSMWPGAPEQLDEVFRTNNVPDDEINKMTFENAMRWYHFDPFRHMSRDQATVGALRKAAEGHDVSIQALSHHEKGSRGEALHAAARANSGD